MFLHSVSSETFDENWGKIEDALLAYAEKPIKGDVGGGCVKGLCEEAHNAVVESGNLVFSA